METGIRKKLKTCKNPFHYLERWCDLSGQRRSRCACSDSIIVKKKSEATDIRRFFQFPKITWSTSDRSKLSIVKHISAPSRSDLIKKAHDREKKGGKQKTNPDG